MTPTDNQDKLTSDFQFIFTALTQLGHDPNDLIDRSEVIPAPKPFTGQATFPAGKTMADVEQAVSTRPWLITQAQLIISL